MMTYTHPDRELTPQCRHSRAADPFERYQAELSSDLLDEQGALIDWLIGFAFDTLGTRVLDVRVVPAEHLRPATNP